MPDRPAREQSARCEEQTLRENLQGRRNGIVRLAAERMVLRTHYNNNLWWLHLLHVPIQSFSLFQAGLTSIQGAKRKRVNEIAKKRKCSLACASGWYFQGDAV
jgi:hypothetical protein